MSSTSIYILPFNGKDYSLWKIKVLAHINGQGWSSVIDNPKPITPLPIASSTGPALPLAEAEQKKWQEIAPKVYAFLVTSLSNDVLSLFANVATGDPHVLWKAMLRHYERDTVAS